MKTKILSIFVAISMGFACTSVKDIATTKLNVETKINSDNYTISFNYVNPARLRPHHLTSDYTLTIKGDTAIAYLPYFGVAHTAVYGSGEGGIRFTEKVNNFEEKRNRKNDGWDITFDIKAEMQSYKMMLNIYDSGSSTLYVTPSNKDAISYNGEMKF